MANQDNFLGGSNSFGVESTSDISDEMTSLIFGGGSTAANPEDIKPIPDKEDKEEKEEVENFLPKVELTEDDILGPLEEDKPITKKKEDKATEEDTEEDEPSGKDGDTFKVLSKNLIDMGVFKPRDGQELPKTSEEFAQRWQQEQQEQVNEGMYNFIISKHGEEGLQVFQDIFVNGVDPQDYLSKYATIQSFENLDLSLESNQEKVFREAYRRQGLSEDKVEKKLQRAKDYGDLEDEVTDLHDLILKQDKEELETKSATEALKERQNVEMKQQYAANISNILTDKLKQKDFDGIPVTDKVAKETYDYLVSEKWQLPSGEKLTDFDKDILELRDPKNHELKLKLALLLKGKLDLTKIKNKVISAESGKLFEDLTIKQKQQRKANNILPTRSFMDGL